MDRIEIPNVEVKTIFGPAYRIAQRDADGDVLWENPDEPDQAKRLPKMEGATTASLLRDLLINLQGDLLRRLQKSEDSHRAHKLWNAIEEAVKDTALAKEAGYPSVPPISVRVAEHTWLHRVLKRKVPLAGKEKEAKPSDVEERTVAQVMWGLSEFEVRRLLRCLSTEEETDLQKEKAEEETPAVVLEGDGR